MNHVKNRARKIGNGIAKIGRWLVTPASPEEIPYADLQADTATLLDVTGAIGYLTAPSNSRVHVTPVATHFSGATSQTAVLPLVQDTPPRSHANKPEPPQPPRLTLYRGSACVSEIERSRTSSAATKRAAALVKAGNWEAALAGLEAYVAAHPAKDTSRHLVAA